MQQAALLLAQFTAGRSFTDYLNDAMLRSAVERQFEIIGEALSQLAKRDPEVAAGISHRRSIIAFRNTLIHGYSDVDDGLVWDVLAAQLPPSGARSTPCSASRGPEPLLAVTTEGIVPDARAGVADLAANHRDLGFDE
jgi:uncharacterized protein with HEPN domain